MLKIDLDEGGGKGGCRWESSIIHKNKQPALAPNYSDLEGGVPECIFAELQR